MISSLLNFRTIILTCMYLSSLFSLFYLFVIVVVIIVVNASYCSLFVPGFWLCENDINRGFEILHFQWTNCDRCSSCAIPWSCGHIYGINHSLVAYMILTVNLNICFYGLVKLTCLQQGSKRRMPGTAVTKSVVANEPGGRKREEIFVDIIEKISVTFSSSVSILPCSVLLLLSVIKINQKPLQTALSLFFIHSQRIVSLFGGVQMRNNSVQTRNNNKQS